jgi:hypothetical protein
VVGRPQIDKLLVSASDLRGVVHDIISSTIETHRASRKSASDSYIPPIGGPTEEEINDFIICNPLYDVETVGQLVEPGLLGFDYPKALLSESALRHFREQTLSWAKANEWIGGDLVPYYLDALTKTPDETSTWLPGNKIERDWFSGSPSALLIAVDLLKSGRLLAELDWRSFEKLIGELLEKEGYKVELTRASKDGGIDIIATIHDRNIGLIRSIWQAKKYSPSHKVRLAEVRELSGLVAKPDVTKGVMVTTSHLTRGALDWIKKDTYRLSFKDKDAVEEWILQHI